MLLNFLGGGCIGYEYRFPTVTISLINSYAFMNNAMFGGVTDMENFNSAVFVTDCVFEANFAYMSLVKAGAGNALMLKGDYTTKLYIKNCLFIDSGITMRGFYL